MLVGSLKQLQQPEQGPPLCTWETRFEFVATGARVHASKLHNVDGDEAPRERTYMSEEAQKGKSLKLESKLNRRASGILLHLSVQRSSQGLSSKIPHIAHCGEMMMPEISF